MCTLLSYQRDIQCGKNLADKFYSAYESAKCIGAVGNTHNKTAAPHDSGVPSFKY